ncbi:hypothetical protein HpHA245_01740 [Helicobacter pylori]
MLESGAKKHGAKKVLIRHYGVENTGGLTNEELLNMGEVIKNGSVLLESLTLKFLLKIKMALLKKNILKRLKMKIIRAYIC